MAFLIQKKNSVVNIIDTAQPTGSKIISTLPLSCTAYPVAITAPGTSKIQFRDVNSKVVREVPFDASLQIQKEGDAAVIFSGTMDDIINVLNTEFLATSQTTPIQYCCMTESTLQAPIIKGTLTELKMRPAVLNEQNTDSVESMAVVSATETVGQVFRASQDNINGVFVMLESAESDTAIDYIEQANDAALQADWVLTGANLATLDLLIKSPNLSSTKSMKLNLSAFDEWSKTVASTDLTGATIIFDYYQSIKSTIATVDLKISDGVNTSVVSIPVQSQLINTWQTLSIPVAALEGTANVAAITSYAFKVKNKSNGEFAHVDNLRFRAKPGFVTFELWHHGGTQPLNNGTVDYTSGTRIQLGDLGIGGVLVDSINKPLLGGKRVYSISNLIAGVAFEYASNSPLVIDDYYSIVIKYVDTNVSVYGTDTTQSIKRYSSGYAWSAQADNKIDLIQGVAGSGEYSDLFFGILSTQDVYVQDVELKLVDSSGSITNSSTNSSSGWFIEDESLNATILALESYSDGDHKENLKDDPILMKKGGKIRINYNSAIDDNVSIIVMESHYNYTPPVVNG